MYNRCTSLGSITVGAKYKISKADMFPAATAKDGKWWSETERAWFTKDEVVTNRSMIPDTYRNISSNVLKDLSGAIITGVKTQVYTGKPITPPLTIRYGEKILQAGVDYTLTYKSNVMIGTASIEITGKGEYFGTRIATFQIVSPFTDVTTKTAHFEDIAWLAETGISKGWKNVNGTLSFRPLEGVKRADMAAFLYRLAERWKMVDESWKPLHMSVFRDVNAATAHAREIMWLAEKGISLGWDNPDGSKEFRPYTTVARQDMAAFLFRLAKIAGRGGASDSWSANMVSKTRFNDVDAASPYNHHNEIWWLAQTGISAGWKVGSTYEFRGLQDVARADMAAFLHRLEAVE